MTPSESQITRRDKELNLGHKTLTGSSSKIASHNFEQQDSNMKSHIKLKSTV